MQFHLYPDASSVRNQYSWAFVLIGPEAQVEGSGRGGRNTNEGELQAAIEGLKRTPPGAIVTVYTDSEFVLYHRDKGDLQDEFHKLRTDRYVTLKRANKMSAEHRRAHHLSREVFFA